MAEGAVLPVVGSAPTSSPPVGILERIADVVFVFCIVSTTLTRIPLLGIGGSWTRDLWTAYLLLFLSVLSGVLRRWRSLPVFMCLTLLAASVLGAFNWGIGKSSEFALNFWVYWLLGASLLLFACAYGRQRVEAWARYTVVWSVLLGAFQVVGLLLARDELATMFPGDSGFNRARPLGAEAALWLALGFLLVVQQRWQRPGYQRAIALFLGLSVVFAQHRSVWLALIVGAVVLVAVPGLRRPYAELATLAGAFVVASLLPKLTGLSVLPGGTGGMALPESTTNVGTLAWRLEMWQTRLGFDVGLTEFLFGGIFGVARIVVPGDGVKNPLIQAHNAYVESYVYLGVIGLALMLALFVLALRSALVGQPQLVPMLASLMIFALFYSWPSWSFILVGVSLSFRLPAYRGGKLSATVA